MNLSQRITQLTGLAAMPLLLISCSPQTQEAELILTNAYIWTGNPEQPQAQGLAISGDTLLAVGSNEEILRLKGADTKLIDVDGRFIAPGFIDTHVHLVDGGFNLISVKLRDAKSPEEFVERIAQYAATVPPGTWIIGGEWDGSDWEEVPSKEWIDLQTPDHPVFLTGVSGHIALANSLAIEMAGIPRDVADVEGGVIGRDASGQLTGIFKDNAMTLISSKIPKASDELIDDVLKKAMYHFNSQGVTTVHNVWYPTDSPGHDEAFQRAYDSKNLSLRIFTLGALKDWKERADKVSNPKSQNKWLKINGLKGVFDGALGSHTAAFSEPYTDAPADRGLFMLPEDDLYNWVSAADKSGLQVAIHAIGDRAIHKLLNNFERIQKENGNTGQRFRVEHAQHIAPEDIPRFAELNVIPSMQPYHAIDDGRWAEALIGPERIKTTYAFKSLLDAGARVSFGSDWPVAPASPLLGIYAATTRRTLDDKNPGGWVPEQKITVAQALTAYTVNGAYASFDEEIKGSLEPGKLADFIILSENLFEIDPVKIKDVTVLQTYVGGEKVFDFVQ